MDKRYVNDIGTDVENVIMRAISRIQNHEENIRSVIYGYKQAIDYSNDAIHALEDVKFLLQNLAADIAFPITDYVIGVENYYEATTERRPYIPLEHFTDKETIDVSYNTEERPCWVYFIESETTHFVKIGITVNLKRRMDALIAASGDSIKVRNVLQCKNEKNAKEIEAFLHKHFSQYRHYPNGRSTEWFDNRISETVVSMLALGEDELLKAIAIRNEELKISMDKLAEHIKVA